MKTGNGEPCPIEVGGKRELAAYVLVFRRAARIMKFYH